MYLVNRLKVKSNAENVCLWHKRNSPELLLQFAVITDLFMIAAALYSRPCSQQGSDLGYYILGFHMQNNTKIGSIFHFQISRGSVETH